MDKLEAAKGKAFDRLFLRYMTQHHQGALTMVQDLVEQGGGVETEIEQFILHVDSDQSIEIDADAADAQRTLVTARASAVRRSLHRSEAAPTNVHRIARFDSDWSSWRVVGGAVAYLPEPQVSDRTPHAEPAKTEHPRRRNRRRRGRGGAERAR